MPKKRYSTKKKMLRLNSTIMNVILFGLIGGATYFIKIQKDDMDEIYTKIKNFESETQLKKSVTELNNAKIQYYRDQIKILKEQLSQEVFDKDKVKEQLDLLESINFNIE